MPEVWTPVLIGTVGLCVFLYGVSKTAMPVLGVLASPLLAAALTPTVAAGFMVPLLLLGDLIALAVYRQHVEWRVIGRILPGLLVGLVLTAVLFLFADITTVGRVVGALILISVILEASRMRRAPMEVPPSGTPWDRLVTGFFGALAGVTTFAANAGGSAMSLYLIRLRVPMLTFMGTSVWFFFILNLVKVPLIAAVGLFSVESLRVGALMAPLTVAGAVLGIYVFRRMDQRIFVIVALVLSAFAAVWLLIHG